MTPTRLRPELASAWSSARISRARLGSPRRRASLAALLIRAFVGLAAACGGSDGSGGGSAARGTGASEPVPAAKSAQAAADSVASHASTATASAADSPATGADTVGTCDADQLEPERLDLAAEWQKGHVHVAGRVPDGAGKTLVLSLSYAGKFVFDEVFRGERLAAIELASDSVDVRSISYAPTPSEQAAFDRRGAVALATAPEPCLDIAFYDRLDLLANRHISLPPHH